MTKKELRKLIALRHSLTLTNAAFRDRLVEPESRFGEVEKKTIAEVTRVWRQTYILPVLDNMIEKYEKKWTK